MSGTALIPAVFMRGGTSKAIVFKGSDLPTDRTLRDKIFLHVLGSPDAYGRQLDGLGGGLSSLSKAVIVDRSSRDDADIDYTFVQIAVDKPVADYGSMCGNMSAAVGPFAVDEGLVVVSDGEADVRVHNTNTSKIFHATFPVQNGRAVETGDFLIPGVSTRGACVRLDNLDPGGAVTGHLLPTGRPIDRLSVEGVGEIEASLVDASNPVVFVRASDLGCTATENPADLDGNAALMACLENIRRAAGVAMGMADAPGKVPLSNPKVAIVAAPAPFRSLDGAEHAAENYDIAIRIISMGNTHRAVTLTGAMCLAVAARIEGTIPNQLARQGARLRIGNPSGLLPVAADVATSADGKPIARSAVTFRTQRRLMQGAVPVPAHLLAGSNSPKAA